jgi:hypothetical protein
MPIFVEEAKAGERTCPLSFGVLPLYGPDNNNLRSGGPFGCIGHHCMAWRFGRTRINDDADDALGPRVSDDTHGYCGLAGVPGQLLK